MTDPTAHWESVYRTKPFDGVSWYAPHLETSLRQIVSLVPRKDAAIIDVGGGESTLVDDLLDRGYTDLCVLDVSTTAIAFTQRRLGERAGQVHWHAADITRADLGRARFDLWHDRAVFHFLTDAAQRAAYVERLHSALKPGGSVVIATFGPEGPLRCSGLEIVRYDAARLVAELGAAFHMLGSERVMHATPFGTQQQFQYVWGRIR